MKPRARYLINPIPFGIVVANPKRKSKKRRNPMSKKPGIYVIRKGRKRNPRKKRRRSAKRRNPLKLKHILVTNPHRRRAHKKRRRNPHQIAAMSKRTRRKTRKATYRRNSARRNPARRKNRRSRVRRMRNPIGIVNDMFNPNMLTFAGGVVISELGTRMIMNRLISGDPVNHVPAMKLPGINYTPPVGVVYTAAAPWDIWRDNAWMIAAYKLVIGGVAGYLLRNQSPRLSQGIMVGAVAGAITDVVAVTGVLKEARGTHRYFPGPRGAGAYVPGVPSIFTGPAAGFLGRGAPMARGTRTMVSPRQANDMVRSVSNFATSN